ncbi:Rap guanine nucleotide exchange factor 2 [Holothuria leucospilota]|uniref:Rap guanine nucleotide exchange factor 2 n=1 Tax=Holothuria leucospilota TaxID=206669 RepID=A0A9Q0YIJ0_HOLLE|nr:Rap guanine nucleotide exchange factor 2 [Holothuria leucospilota]
MNPNKMSTYVDPHFVRCLQKPPEERTKEELQNIFCHLHDLEALRSLREPAIREIAKSVRYEKREANEILYCRENLSTCWYILLSGSVFIDHAMYLPRSSFGKRTSGTGRRETDCLILETSELLVIDYPDAQFLIPGQRQSGNQSNLEKLMALDPDELKVSSSNRGRSLSEDRGQSLSDTELELSDSDTWSHTLTPLSTPSFLQSPPSIRLERTQSLDSEQKTKKDVDDVHLVMDQEPGRRMQAPIAVLSTPTHTLSTGDRSSMHSSIGSSISDLIAVSSEFDQGESNSIGENAFDSDDDETSESSGSLYVRDIVRDCLEKDPHERTEDEIEILLDFMRHLPALSTMTMSVRKALCSFMVFAVVQDANTVVMKDREELDSWSVILNGHVEITRPDGSMDQLHLGDSFGVAPTMDKQYHEGVMRTTVDDCQFVCIAQEHYCRILTQGEENKQEIKEDGKTVMVMEPRVVDDRRQGYIVIKAIPEKLIGHLMADQHLVDPTYVEDFLMTYRAYMSSPQKICDSLLQWFMDESKRDKVTRSVLLWVNNYYNDFENNPDMIEFLEEFEDHLEREDMGPQLRLLHIAGAAKAKPRTLILARSDRDSPLSCSIVGGWEKRMSIFISKVEKGSKAQKVGLRKGDQILEVNGHNFEHMTKARALEILKGTTHLSITVKYNTLGLADARMGLTRSDSAVRDKKQLLKSRQRAFRDILASQDSNSQNWGRQTSQDIALLQSDPRARLTIPDIALSMHKAAPEIKDKKGDKKSGYRTLGHKNKLQKAMARISILPNKGNSNSTRGMDDSASTSSSQGHNRSSSLGSNPYLSNSNPDLSTTSYTSTYDANYPYQSNVPDEVLKIFRADQSCKYFLVHKETNAGEIVMLAIQEFGIPDSSPGQYCLCEVTVGQGGLVKQKRLPDHQSNISEKLSLSGRLFLRNNMSSETLVSDELAVELLKEGSVSFLQLDPIEVATQLSLRDYKIFQRIESTDFIDNLFDLPRPVQDSDALKEFEDLVNLEMFWVVTEVCCETSIVKRAKILKHFIKIAKHCKDCRNFNSMFSLISGLGHGSVSRLKNTWDKVPSKYIKMFEDLNEFLDPSRNMSKYRNLLNAENAQPPLLPFFPVVKKDLTFIHLGNKTEVDGLINFEKLRMIAKEVRYINNLGNGVYDPKHLLVPNSNQSNGSGGTIPRKRSRERRISAALNPKKMWEEAQMARRVILYLGSVVVTQDEEELRELSLKCEPVPANTGSFATLPRRKAKETVTSSTPSSPSNSHNPSPTHSSASNAKQQEEKMKQLIYKDAPKTSFGVTSPKNLKKILALSEEGEKRMKNMKFDRGTVSEDNTTSSSPPSSPKHGFQRRAMRKSQPAQGKGTRQLSPQRSDSGYGGSDAGSTSSRMDQQDPRRRHTVASGPIGAAGLLGASYDSSDSGQLSSFDTTSNSSLGSASPPGRHTTAKKDAPTRHFSSSSQEMMERKPPDYEEAARRASETAQWLSGGSL